ncbi:MAG: mannose-1-phosphate guanylyltransferase [Bacteroidetes bacterium]|nr:mannose-1-phosphate guanylyltransferase [Bacteroidota bacterium]
MRRVYTVIMAGGIGTRFWPVSREKRPKQFLDILGTGKTLLQQTFDRYTKICPRENIYIVTSTRYIDLVKNQIEGIDEKQILGEPSRRNTAPCLAYAAHKIYAIDPKANMVIAPSDHLILNEDIFIEVIKHGLKVTQENDFLLTLGIRPTRPDTGYGYIQYLKNIKVKEPHDPIHPVFKVKTFTEKPTLELAKTFVKSGDFLWNSGMFIWNVKTIMNSFAKHLPELYEIFQEGKDELNTVHEESFLKRNYSQCEKISIDYGIMEKADNVYVIPSTFGWSDLGTWSSLNEKLEKDYLGNAIMGENIMVYDTRNTTVIMPDDKLAVIHGLNRFIVVEADGILMIIPNSQEQNVQQILSDIKRNKGDKYL